VWWGGKSCGFCIRFSLSCRSLLVRIAITQIGTAVAITVNQFQPTSYFIISRRRPVSSLVLMQLDVLSGRSRDFELFDWLSGFWPAAAAGTGLVVLGWLAVRWANLSIQQVDPGESDRQMLQALEEMKQGGELSDGEFRLIKGRLANRLSSLPMRPANT
jgi:hypothetical protein